MDETIDVIAALRRKRLREKDNTKGLNLVQSMVDSVEKRYELIEKLGSGGMKDVFLARDLQTTRHIAYAQIKKEQDKPLNTRRFIREARITAMLQHPNIIPVHDVGIDENNKPFFTMKLLEGEDLQSLLMKLQKGDEELKGSFPLNRLLEIFLECCRAIAYAHSKGIVHLDLKPSNIHLSHFDEVLVSDWGIAAFIGETPERQEIESMPNADENFTKCGMLKGTPGFMAPEQITTDFSKIGPATDIYQLGGLLYAILTYFPPISMNSLEESFQATLKGDIVRPSKRAMAAVPAPLEAIVMKAMSLQAQDRYGSVSELIVDIKAYQMGFATSAWRANVLDLTLLLYRRHKVKILTAGAFMVMIFIITSIFMVQLVKSKREAFSARDKAKVLAQEVTAALEVAKEKSKQAEKSEKALVDIKKDIRGNIELVKKSLPKMIQDKVHDLKDDGRFLQLKFLVENDPESFIEYPFDSLWMLYENELVSDERFKNLAEGLKKNPVLDIEVYEQLIETLFKMRQSKKRVSQEECANVLTLLRKQAKISPNSVAAFVMRTYHQRYLEDPIYPSYLEAVFQKCAALEDRVAGDQLDLHIEVENKAWKVELKSTLKSLSLSSLAFLPIESFKASGCWAPDYVALSTWPLKHLDIESSGFKIEDNWSFEILQLDYLRLIDCPFMNWPRLLDIIPSRKVVIPRGVAKHVQPTFLKKYGIELIGE